MTHHTVVWDGRRQGPGGAYLAADADAAVAATASPQRPRQSYGDVRRLVLLSLQGAPKTLRDLVDDTGCPLDAVNKALYSLLRYREVEKVGERHRPEAGHVTYAGRTSDRRDFAGGRETGIPHASGVRSDE